MKRGWEEGEGEGHTDKTRWRRPHYKDEKREEGDGRKVPRMDSLASTGGKSGEQAAKAWHRSSLIRNL